MPMFNFNQNREDLNFSHQVLGIGAGVAIGRIAESLGASRSAHRVLHPRLGQFSSAESQIFV